MSTPSSHLFCFEGGLGARCHSCLSFPSLAGSSLLHRFSKQGSPSDHSLMRGDVPRDSTTFPVQEQKTAEKSSFYSHFLLIFLFCLSLQQYSRCGKSWRRNSASSQGLDAWCVCVRLRDAGTRLLNKSLFKIHQQEKPKAPPTRCRQGKAWTHLHRASPARLPVPHWHQGPLPHAAGLSQAAGHAPDAPRRIPASRGFI